MWLEYLFIFSCHQMEGRSPSLEGEFFPICFRCAGLFFGIFSVYFSMIFFKKQMNIPISKRNILFLSFLFLPLMLDGAANYFGLWHSTPSIRIISGLFAGIFLAAAITPFLKFQKKNIKFSSVGFIFALFIGIILITILQKVESIFIFDLLKYAATLGFIFYAASLLSIIKNFKSI